MDITWIASSANGEIPPNAVFAGVDSDGEAVFVGRAHYAGYLMPAKVLPNKKGAYISHEGKGIHLENYEILSGQGFDWVASSGGESVPTRAVSGGKTTYGETLYIGRGYYEGCLSIGKIHLSHKCLYVPCGDKEKSLNQYECLVSTNAWIKSTGTTDVPPDAVFAGNDSDGSEMYVGRAYHEGNLIPAKVIPKIKVAFINHSGQQYKVDEYEMLCGDGFLWVDSDSGNIPNGAVAGGSTVTGEKLYIGRGYYEKCLTPGKVQPSHGCLQIAHSDGERSITEYEILVKKSLYIGRRLDTTDVWIQSVAGNDIPPDAVFAGNDSDGSEMFIGRAYHDGNLVPAKVIPTHQSTYISYKGKVIKKYEYEILCGNGFAWIASTSGNVPSRAVPGGNTVTGEILYIGRGKYLETLQPGKIQPSHGCLQIAHGVGEWSLSEYEVLVRKSC